MEFPGRNALFYLLLSGLLLPAEAFVIPLYYNLRTVGLTDTYWALILPQAAQSLAFGIFWMRNQFRTFPGEIMEAGRLDGATDWRLLWRIMVPPSTPAIITMCLLVSMWTWNEFLIPLIMVSGESLRTAPLGLAFFQGQHLTDTRCWPRPGRSWRCRSWCSTSSCSVGSSRHANGIESLRVPPGGDSSSGSARCVVGRASRE